MTNDKSYMREYQKLRRNRLKSIGVVPDDPYCYEKQSCYYNLLKNNKEAFKRYKRGLWKIDTLKNL